MTEMSPKERTMAAVIGVLLLRADIAPRPIGYALVAAGVTSCTLLIPELPAPMTALALVAGGLAEGAFAFWMLVAAP